MNILLNSRFVKGIIEKLIERSVRKSTGCNISVTLGEVKANHSDGGPVKLHLDIYGEMEEHEVKKLMEHVGL